MDRREPQRVENLLGLLETLETAAALHVSVPTVRLWTAQGRLAVVKLGRRTFYRIQDLQDLIDRNLKPART